MPKLTSDNNFAPREGYKLSSPDSAAGPGMAQARAGESQRAAAGRLRADAERDQAEINAVKSAHAQFEAAARRAKANSLANNALTNATSEYVTALDQRINSKLDKKGNPTFDTLVKDVQEIGRTIAKKYGAIGDKDASSLFGQHWGSYLAGQLPGILQEARRQQVDFSKASLAKTIEGITTAGGQDRLSNWPVYQKQLARVLRDSIADGTVSAQEAVGIEQKARNQIVTQGLNTMVFFNPEQALLDLKNGSAEDFGATADQYNNAVMTAQARVLQKQQDAAQAAKTAQDQEAANQKATTMATVDLMVQDFNQGKTADLEQAKYAIFSNPNLSDAERITAQKKIQNAEFKKSQEANTSREFMDAVASGAPVATMTGDQIDTGFKTMVANAMQTAGRTLSLREQVMVAKPVRAEIPYLKKQIEAAAYSGSLEEALDAAQALRYSSSTEGNPQNLEGLDTKAEAFLTYLDHRISENSQDPAKAFQQAKDTFFGPRKEFNQDNYNEGKDIGHDYAQDILEASGNWFAGADNLAMQDDVARMFASNFVEAQGDEEVARTLTERQVKLLYGSSQVTGAMEQGMLTGSSVMKYPPERVVGIDPGNSEEMDALKFDLEETVQGVLPKGYSVDDVRYVPIDLPGAVYGKDPRTRIYALYVTDKDGAPVQLELNGQPVKWELYPNAHLEANIRRVQAKDKALREGKVDRSNAMTSQSLLGDK